MQEFCDRFHSFPNAISRDEDKKAALVERPADSIYEGFFVELCAGPLTHKFKWQIAALTDRRGNLPLEI